VLSGTKPGFWNLGVPIGLHFSLGVSLNVSYANGNKECIHIPMNGAKTGFSGDFGYWVELSNWK
jgi:hypothetical protein